MTRADLVAAASDDDTALIDGLRRAADRLAVELGTWQHRAEAALVQLETAVASNAELVQRNIELEREVEQLRRERAR